MVGNIFWQDITYQVSGLALQDGGQDIVKTDRTLKQTGQVTVGGGGAWQGGHALGRGTLGGSSGQRGGSLATHFWMRGKEWAAIRIRGKTIFALLLSNSYITSCRRVDCRIISSSMLPHSELVLNFPPLCVLPPVVLLITWWHSFMLSLEFLITTLWL